MSNLELNRIPPQSIEAEQSLLGALLIDKRAFDKMADIIEPDDFYKDSHRYIYEGMLTLYSKQEPIDILTVSNILEERKQIEIIGGRSYLASLSQLVPTSSHVVQYAHIIKKKATLRRLQNVSAEISDLAGQEDEEIDSLLDSAEHKLFSISQRFLKQSLGKTSS